MDLNDNDDDSEQNGPTRYHKKGHFANPSGNMRPRKPLRETSPNKQDRGSQKEQRFKDPAVGPLTGDPYSNQPRRAFTNPFAGDLGKSKWVPEQHIGALY